MTHYPITLAIDTAQASCQSALIDADGSSYAMSEARARGHAEHVMDQIDALLDNAQREYDDLERIIVSAGPGSFTGLRVGLAAARGLAVALDIPCLGIPTMLALSLSGKDNHPLSVLIDARRDQYFRQEFSAPGKPMSAPAAIDNNLALEGLDDKSRVLGSGAQWAAEQCGVQNLELARDPDMRTFINVVKMAEFGQTAKIEDFPPEPCYIRAPDAKPQSAKHIERL
ncbi:tRNA (adenosine(37)-N6)-threonylcarbamoyltransferase complex dimerization subunit type 1 TsaB [Maritalea sp.]|uniref:tRNA (adenosine(37)-N6)-threonylcarbamoyltransferase complex dimerization subunit type 1 TsaB n=1 Tax=Maritalea sp. TaxID=2003361 RepID=UPI003EF94277